MSLTTKIKLITTAALLVLAYSLASSRISNPNTSTIYNLKRLQEKVFMSLRSQPQDKVNYYHILLDKRLAELKFLVKERHYQYILTSSLRYSTTAGQLTELIIAQQMQDVVTPTLDKFTQHQAIIKQLVDTYPTKEDWAWKFVQDDYNYLTIYSDQLSSAFDHEDQP